jgi:RecA-family ATPase
MGFENHPNLNLYAPWSVFRRDLESGKKGSEADVLAVLAAVGDLDNDKYSLGELPVEAPYIVETSPGNFQPVYIFERPLAAADAKPVLAALCDFVGGDSATKDTSHVWRIPGCLNWPTKSKLARGRPPVPALATIKKGYDGRFIDPVTLLALAPPPRLPSGHDTTPGGSLSFAEEARLRGALAVIPAEDRDTWVKVGAALHRVGARAVWDDWSKTSGKFDADDQDRVWDSFHGERKERVATITSILTLAKERGWVPPVNAEEPAADTKAEATALAILRDRAFNPADWQGKRAPPRKSIVPDYIPDETVTLLYADGGTGKSYLKLQLAVARALSREWIGLMPEPGRTLVLSTEDDLNEMWRRIEGMIEAEPGPFAGARMADLGDIRLVDLVGENSIIGLLARGIIEPTPMYAALDAYIAEFTPGLVELDVLADLFSGEENDRPQVTQFVGLLKRLCRNHHCAILLLAQPSVAGMNTGTGTSGSTGWSNSGRSRLYFQRVKTGEGAEPNKNLRTFEGKKANYSEVGGKFDVEWKDGLFRRVIGQTGFDKMAADQKAEDLFLSQLASFTKSGRSVSDSPGANYAPTQFASDKPTQEFLKLAMFRLFDKGSIKIEPGGSPSRPTKKIVLA